jgi:hypothetical protein
VPAIPGRISAISIPAGRSVEGQPVCVVEQRGNLTDRQRVKLAWIAKTDARLLSG